MHGGKGKGVARWVESLESTSDHRPQVKHYQPLLPGKSIAKHRCIRVSKLASLIQPAVVQESAKDIVKITQLVGEHTADQRIRTDGKLLPCVLVGHKYITIVVLCSVASCTTNIARLPKCSWRRHRNSPDLYRLQHRKGKPLQGLLPGGRQRRFAGPLGRATQRHHGLPGKACRGSR